MSLPLYINQGVVTPIGAVLTAKTGDTICVHRNSVVTPSPHLKIGGDP